jgi:membrane associated rhomboid family serine protease
MVAERGRAAGAGEAGRSARGRPLRDAPVTLLLVAANAAAFAWALAHGALGDQDALVRLGALERSRVWAGEPWRLLSAAFLHAGWIHLACNMAAALSLGRLVERALGPVRLAAIYLSSAIAGSALSLLGQDQVSLGASGALFGLAGAVLALHLRALGGWRPFLRSGATRWLVGGLLATSLGGPLLATLDHLAHAGGLGAGAAAAWVATLPRAQRRRAGTAFAAALALLTAGAAWPRSALTRFEAARLERTIHAALAASDAGSAGGAIALADRRGHRSERLEYYRALLHVQRGDLEGALAAARPLAASGEPALRAEALRIVVAAAKTLAYRHYTGDGAERDARRGLAYMEEACRGGDGESCRNAERVRGERP